MKVRILVSVNNYREGVVVNDPDAEVLGYLEQGLAEIVEEDANDSLRYVREEPEGHWNQQL